LCEQPLKGLSRIPVCPSCLALPSPLVAEFFCGACRTTFADAYPLDEHGLCSVCRESLASFDTVYSFGSYEGPLRKLIHLFKYAKIESLAAPLSRFLIRALPLDQQFDAVLAMPMHWRKRWERGFNQAELLAKPIAERYGLKLKTNLQRARYTKAQAGLSEAQRRENLQGSFCVKRPEEIRNRGVLLIDDVFTTGATLRAASAALKRAGARHITALTLARVDHRPFEMGWGRFSSSAVAGAGVE
jgi:ComF family protein